MSKYETGDHSTAPSPTKNCYRNATKSNAAHTPDSNNTDASKKNRVVPASNFATSQTGKEAGVQPDDRYPINNLIYQRQPWTADAACRNKPTDWWFPDRGGDFTKAKQICATCPVKQQCLDYSLTLPALVGIWGGLTGRERRAHKAVRTQRLIKHGTNSGYAVHRKRGEEPCDDCKKARNVYQQELKQRKEDT